MTKCAILGAGGHGKVVADMAELIGYEEVYFFDDRWPLLNFVEHWPVIGTAETLEDHVLEYDLVVVAIGDNAVRLAKYKRLFVAQANCAPLIHPRADVSRYSHLGAGSVVMSGAVVNAFCHVGSACIINTSATVDHDCILGDAVHICPGSHLAGSVEVGSFSWVGIGACVRQSIRIGNHSIVAAGSTVVSPVLDEQVVAGTPAKPMKL